MKPRIPFQEARIQFPLAKFRHPAFFLLLSLLLVWTTASIAAKESGNPIPTKGPLVSQLSEDLDPSIPGPETIIRKFEDAQGNQVKEFAINGNIFQIQVIPVNGPPYLLIDNDGDGLFENRLNGYEDKINVPQWVLFKF